MKGSTGGWGRRTAESGNSSRLRAFCSECSVRPSQLQRETIVTDGTARLGAIGTASALIMSFPRFVLARGRRYQPTACLFQSTDKYLRDVPAANDRHRYARSDQHWRKHDVQRLEHPFTVDASFVVAGIGAGMLDFMTNPALLGAGGSRQQRRRHERSGQHDDRQLHDDEHDRHGAIGERNISATFWVVWTARLLQLFLDLRRELPGSWAGPEPGPPAPRRSRSSSYRSRWHRASALTHNGGAEPGCDFAIASGPLPANPGGAPDH